MPGNRATSTRLSGESVASGLEALADAVSDQYPGVTFTPSNGRSPAAPARRRVLSSRTNPRMIRLSAMARGELAIVLHTHMPYVEGGAEWPPRDYSSFLRNPEGFGTWPFGEEWLWEAIATSYVPLLDVLGRAPITLSLTPVLAINSRHLVRSSAACSSSRRSGLSRTGGMSRAFAPAVSRI